MPKPAATVRVTEDAFDQWRAAQVGATIGFNKHGQPQHEFKTWEQYQRYMALNQQRGNYRERAVAQ